MRDRPGLTASQVPDETHGALDPGLDPDASKTLVSVVGGPSDGSDQQPNEFIISDPHGRRSLSQYSFQVTNTQCTTSLTAISAALRRMQSTSTLTCSTQAGVKTSCPAPTSVAGLDNNSCPTTFAPATWSFLGQSCTIFENGCLSGTTSFPVVLASASAGTYSFVATATSADGCSTALLTLTVIISSSSCTTTSLTAPAPSTPPLPKVYTGEPITLPMPSFSSQQGCPGSFYADRITDQLTSDVSSLGIQISPVDGSIHFNLVPTIELGPWVFIISLTFNGVVYTQTFSVEVRCKLTRINQVTISTNYYHDLALGSSSFFDLPVLTNNCGSLVQFEDYLELDYNQVTNTTALHLNTSKIEVDQNVPIGPHTYTVKASSVVDPSYPFVEGSTNELFDFQVNVCQTTIGVWTTPEIFIGTSPTLTLPSFTRCNQDCEITVLTFSSTSSNLFIAGDQMTVNAPMTQQIGMSFLDVTATYRLSTVEISKSLSLDVKYMCEVQSVGLTNDYLNTGTYTIGQASPLILTCPLPITVPSECSYYNDISASLQHHPSLIVLEVEVPGSPSQLQVSTTDATLVGTTQTITAIATFAPGNYTKFATGINTIVTPSWTVTIVGGQDILLPPDTSTWTTPIVVNSTPSVATTIQTLSFTKTLDSTQVFPSEIRDVTTGSMILPPTGITISPLGFITCQLADPSYVGLKTFKVGINYNGTAYIYVIAVNFKCDISLVTQANYTTAYSYSLGALTLQIPIPGYTVTPSQCQSLVAFNWAVTWTQLPSAVLSTTGFIDYYSNSGADVGSSKQIQITGTISLDSALTTKTWFANTLGAAFFVDVLQACTPSTITTTQSLPNQYIPVGISTTITINPFVNNCSTIIMPTLVYNVQAGPTTDVAPIDPVTLSNGSLTFNLSNYANVGLTRTFKVVAQDPSNSSTLGSLIFDVTYYCPVTNLQIATLPLTEWNMQLTSNPPITPVVTVTPTACQAVVTPTLTLSATYLFATLDTTSTTIVPATLAVGTQTVTFTASCMAGDVPIISLASTAQIKIVDCSVTFSTPVGPYSTTINLASPGYAVIQPIPTRIYNGDCSSTTATITVVNIADPAADTRTFTVQDNRIDISSPPAGATVGTQTYTASTAWGSSFNFSVTFINCLQTSSATTQTISPTQVPVGLLHQIQVDAFTTNCGTTVVPSIIYEVVNGVGGVPPAGVSIDVTLGVVSFNVLDSTLVGTTHIFEVVAVDPVLSTLLGSLTFDVTFYCGVTSLTIDPIPQVEWLIGQVNAPITPVINVLPQACVLPTLVLVTNPSIIQLDSTSTIIEPGTLVQGLQTIEFKATVHVGSTIIDSPPVLLPINVTACSINALTPTGDKTYTAYGSALTINAPVFSATPTSCPGTFTISLVPVGFADYSAWAQYNSISQALVVQTADTSVSGQYQFQWVATHDNGSGTVVTGSDTFNVIFGTPVCVSVTAIAFAGTLQTNIVVPAAVQTGVTVQLTGYSIVPSYCGANLAQMIAQVNGNWLGSLSVTIDSASGILSFVSTSLSDVGTYTISITTDANLPAGATFDPAYQHLIQNLTFEVVSSCTSMALTSSQMTQVHYIIGDLPVTVPMPTYTGYPAGCQLNLAYSLVLEKTIPDPLFNLTTTTTSVGSLPLPDFITKFDPVLGIVMNGLNFGESWNTYIFRIVATDQSSLPISDNSYMLEVTTQMDCMSGLMFEMPIGFSIAVTYNIGSGVKHVNLDALDSISIAVGINELCGPVVIKVQLTDETGLQLQPLPSFITFDQANAQLAIATADETKAGAYYLKLEVYLSNFASEQQYAHRTEIINLTLATDSPYQVPLPSAETATTTSQPTNTTAINDQLAKEILALQEQINLADETGIVSNSTEIDQAAANITEQVQELIADLLGEQTDASSAAAVEAFAEEFKDIGGLFSAELLSKLPAIDRPIQGYKITLRYADDVQISVNENGMITLEMGEPCVLVNNGEKIDLDLLSLKFVKNSDEQFQMTKWEVKTYTETKIELQLTFDEPLLVSQGNELDFATITLSRLLFIPVNNPYIFEPSQQVRRSMKQVSMIFNLKGELPAQARSMVEFQSLTSITNKVDKASKAAVAIPFIAQVAAKSSMKKLWFYFNTVQVADTFTDFNNVKPPANVQMLQKAYKDIINVKMVPDPVMDNIMENLGAQRSNHTVVNETTTAESTGDSEVLAEPDADHRNLKGLETVAKVINPAAEKKAKSIKRNQIIVAGIAGTFIIAIILICIFKKRIWLSLTSKRRATIRGIYRSIFWNGIVRFMVEMFYPFVLGSLTIIYKTKDFNKNYKECAKVIVFCVFLLYTAYFMHKHRDEIDNRRFKARFGAYLTNCETYKKPKVIWYPTVFMARRLMMALCITFLKVNLVTQVLFTVHTSLLMLAWLITVKPFDTNYKLYLELSNEAIVLTLSYFGFLFSDYVSSPVARYRFGYLYIGILAFGLLVNLFTMGIATIADLVRWWRRRKHQKEVQANLKEKAEQQALQELQLKKKIYAREQAFYNSFEKPPSQREELDSEDSKQDKSENSENSEYEEQEVSQSVQSFPDRNASQSALVENETIQIVSSKPRRMPESLKKDKKVLDLEWQILDAAQIENSKEEKARGRLKRHLKQTEKYFKNYDPQQINLDNIYEQIDTSSAVKLQPSIITKEEAQTVTSFDFPHQKQASVRQVIKQNADLVAQKNTFEDFYLPMGQFVIEDVVLKRWHNKEEEENYQHHKGLAFSLEQMFNDPPQKQEKKKEARHALRKADAPPISLEQMFDDKKGSSPQGSGRTWNVEAKSTVTEKKKPKVENWTKDPYTDLKEKQSTGGPTKFKRAQLPSVGVSAMLSQIREDESKEKEINDLEDQENIYSHTFGARRY